MMMLRGLKTKATYDDSLSLCSIRLLYYSHPARLSLWFRSAGYPPVWIYLFTRFSWMILGLRRF